MEQTSHTNKPKKLIKRLSLTPSSEFEGVKVGVRKDGTPYTVRDDRSRYFKPQEWLDFISKIKPSKQLLFNACLNTGGRIEEIMNLRVDDITFESRTLRLRVTKKKAAKAERIGKRREFQVSSRFTKEIKDYIKEYKLSSQDYLFVPTDTYTACVGEKEKKYYMKKKISAVQKMLRRGLQDSGVKDYHLFSLHNIRKTHGMWLKAVMPYARGLDMAEICMRLGHDFNTYIKHYGSPSIFTDKDINMIIYQLGDIYGLNAK